MQETIKKVLFPTKESVLESVESGEYSKFSDLRDESLYSPEDSPNNNVPCVVEDRNLGDGNELFVTIWFPEYSLYVSMG